MEPISCVGCVESHFHTVWEIGLLHTEVLEIHARLQGSLSVPTFQL